MPRKLPEAIRRLYPFTGKYFSHKTGKRSLNLHYLDEGAGEGEVVLMLHGNPSWSFLYREVVASLRDDFRCIVPDHLGCGLSDQPDVPGLYDLRQHTERLVALIEHLGIKKFHLIVHDWGGAIGFGLARRMPERIGKIIVMNTAAFRSNSIPRRIAVCRWPLIGAILTRGLNGFVRAAEYMTTVNPLSERIRMAYRWPHQSWATRVSVWRFVRDIPLEKKHPSRGEIRATEEGLAQFASHPILLCWGMQDWCFHGGFLKEFQRHFPKATTLSYPDAGHWLLEDKGAVIVPRIRAFLQSDLT
ncbi:MAG: alpha/beta fold hydrolase [Verrucomicrobiota bacterium]|nr:alpha/beta fold hydrolase [Verrucomicrobiota bacterium]